MAGQGRRRRSKSGDILAEIETDKATMEFEAVDEGTIAKILVPEGTDGVKVGAPIAIMAGEGEDASARPPAAAPKADSRRAPSAPKPEAPQRPAPTRAARSSAALAHAASSRRNAARCRRSPPRPQARGRPRQGVAARPPARRGAEHRSRALQGSGPGGRIVRADVDARRRQGARCRAGAPPLLAAAAAGHAVACPAPIEQAIPHEAVKLSNMRKTIARRLTEVEAADPAHLSDRRHPARRAAQASRRAQRRASKAAASSSASTTC